MKKIAILLSIISVPSVALAHVGYVIGDEARMAMSGNDASFLLNPLMNLSNIWLIVVVGVVTILLVIFVPKFNWFTQWKGRMYKRLNSYEEFLPWIARLSLGIALLGAGTEGALISPVAHATQIISFIEIILGFSFLIGFLLVPITILSIALYIFALVNNFYIFGNLDFLALSLAFLAFHNERPGFDDIFNFKILYNLKLPRHLASLLLRIGIGGGMIFLAIYEKILNPHMSELVVNNYHLTSFIPVSPAMWVLSVGIIEILVGFMLLIGWYTRLVSVIAFGILTLSFFYFKESVTSHVTLFGLLSSVFILGGGYLSIDDSICKSSLITKEN